MFRMSTTPPNLAASAAHILFRYTFNLNWLQLRRNTKYNLYVYDVASNRIPPQHLLPPSFSKIRIMYSFDQPRRKHHYQCPGFGNWHGANTVMFKTPAEAIAQLVKYKDLF